MPPARRLVWYERFNAATSYAISAISARDLPSKNALKILSGMTNTSGF